MKSIASKISDTEFVVMDVIWNHDGPITFTEIRSVLGETDWAADTIRTMVRRLHQKGALNQEKRDVYYYAPAVSRDEYMEAKTKDLVGRVYGGNVKDLISALMHYESVPEDELDELKKYWRKGREDA